MIPREIIEEIRYRNDIEEVVASYVTLKQSGSNKIGLCPFHSEKTPSFTVFGATSGYNSIFTELPLFIVIVTIGFCAMFDSSIYKDNFS